MNNQKSLKKITTKGVSDCVGYTENSIRSRLCKTGSFFGIKPIKLPSGRLLWPAEQVEKLISGIEE